MKPRFWLAGALAVLALLVAAGSGPARAEAPYTTWALGPGFDLFRTQDAYTPINEVDLPLDGAEDLFVTPDGTMYIADTGHGQILKLRDFEIIGTYGQDLLKGPTGIFVDEAGTMYIADADQNSIVILDADGHLINQFGRPAEPLFGRNREFLPRKLVVDARRNIYIISEGSVNGIVQMNTNGNFIGYFGANASTMSLKMILQRLFLTDEQLEQFIKNEAASPSNIAIDQQSLIYTITAGTSFLTSIKRFTVSGKNIFPGAYGSSTFRDIQVSANGLLLAVDADGFIVEYDQNGDMLFLFGAADTGDQRLGTLRNPAAIDRYGEEVYVLDQDKNAVVVYRSTAFAQKVHEGVKYYVDGFYAEAKPYFEEVLQYNGSFLMAYQAIGDAYFKAGDYPHALAAYRTAGQQYGYSQSYWELRNQVLQRYLAPFLTYGFVALVGLNVLGRVEKRRKWLDPLRQAGQRLQRHKLVDDVAFLFRFIRQPLDSFYYLKNGLRGSLLFAGLLYLWVVIVWVGALYVTGFPFARYVIPQWIEPENEILNLVVVLVLWNVANYLISTISDGEGRVRDVIIGTAYSLFPYALFMPLLVLASNVLTYNEAFLFNFSEAVIYCWTGLMLFLMVKEIHNYSFTETVRNVLLTLFTMGLFVLTGYILYVLFTQLFDFVTAIVQEVGASVAKLRPLLTLGLAALLLVAGAGGARPARAQGGTVDSNQFTQPDVVDTDWTINQVIPASYALKAENDKFQLYANLETLAFKVVDKRSGYVWSSNLDEVTDDGDLNRTWTAFASSGLSLDYLDEKANTKRLSITSAAHTQTEVAIPDGFQVNVTFTDASLSIGLAVRLEVDGVSVAIPFDSIVEADPEAKLGLVYVYPFLGATKEDAVPGYMFIPDGPGTLIRFAAETKAVNMFYGRYYGADLGMLSTLPYEPTVNRADKLSVPVFGMVHGYQQNAFVAIVEQGAGYGEVQAHPAGVTTRFNFIYNAFVYNESYFQATNRSGAGVTTLQPSTNAFDIVQHYRFLTGADSDYVGMARSYQQYLVGQGVLTPAPDPQADIPIRLEFLAGDKEQVLIWKRLIKMTTVAQMRAILADLALTNPEVIYYGWQPLGASTMPPTSLKLDGALGSLAELKQLAADIQAGGGRFSLYLDPQAALRNEGGYSARNDLAMSITNNNLLGYNRNIVNYFLNLDALRQRFSALSDAVAAQLDGGLALDGLGTNLYSDFKHGHLLNREQAIDQYQTLLAEPSERLGFYQPNDYVFGAMQAYYDMPLSNSGYLYTTDVVPFLPIVLAGYVPVYGPAMNFSSNSQDDLLRQVDFGLYPSFYLSNDETAKILNTRVNWIYTSSYAQWADAVKTDYAWLNARLAPVQGQAIVARQVLVKGVVATTYANGRQIVVNYNAQPYSAGGLSVGAQDAIVREVTP